jgi:hypothetical protein
MSLCFRPIFNWLNLVCILNAFLFSISASANPVLADDHIQWKFQTNSRVMSIADLHADVGALREILVQNNFINQANDWIAGSDHLVINGDFVSEGNGTRNMLDFLIDLQIHAEARGGKVHIVLGNHEIFLLMGNFKYLSPHDQNELAQLSLPRELKIRDDLLRVFSGNSMYSTWLGKQNSIIQINNLIYVHAGLGHWALNVGFGDINSTIRAWLVYYRTRYSPDELPQPTPMPIAETEWVVRGNGPLLSKGLSDPNHDLSPNLENNLTLAELNEVLRNNNADTVIVSHIMTRDRRIARQHSLYGGKVIQTDTGISSAHKGHLSALIVESGIVKEWHGEKTAHPILCKSLVLSK